MRSSCNHTWTICHSGIEVCSQCEAERMPRRDGGGRVCDTPEYCASVRRCTRADEGKHPKCATVPTLGVKGDRQQTFSPTDASDPAAQSPNDRPSSPAPIEQSDREICWTDKNGTHYSMSQKSAEAELCALFERFPNGTDEMEASLGGLMRQAGRATHDDARSVLAELVTCWDMEDELLAMANDMSDNAYSEISESYNAKAGDYEDREKAARQRARSLLSAAQEAPDVKDAPARLFKVVTVSEGGADFSEYDSPEAVPINRDPWHTEEDAKQVLDQLRKSTIGDEISLDGCAVCFVLAASPTKET